MPTIDSPLLFGLAIGPAMFLAVILHEAGHVIAARCVGVKVIAWGVGYRRPWYHRRLRASTFYLGLPLTGGLTIPFRAPFTRQPGRDFLLVLGGPLASAFGLAIGLVLFAGGLNSVTLFAWICASAICVMLSAVPFVFSSQSVRFASDAHRLITILVHGCLGTPGSLGASLGSGQALTELLTAIGCESEIGHFHSAIGIFKASLGDVDGARASLVAAQASPDSSQLAIYQQLFIATVENEDDVEQLVTAAHEQFRGNEAAEFAIDCLHEDWRLKRSINNSDERQALLERATAARNRDWMCWADTIRFEADAFEDVESRCRELLSRYRHQLSGVGKARILALTAERLASQPNNVGRAQILSSEAAAAIAREAAAIGELTTRSAYLRSASQPLQNAAKLANLAPPIIDIKAHEDQSRRRRIFANAATYLCGISLVLVAGHATLMAGGFAPSDSFAAILLPLLAVLIWMLGLIAIMISILRSERGRWRLLSIASILAIATLIVMALGFSRFASDHRHQAFGSARSAPTDIPPSTRIV